MNATAERIREPATATITVEEAARLLGIGRQTAYRAVWSGQIPAIRLGTRWVIPRAGLERLLAGDGQPRR